jgi:hypothetical protein
MQKKAPEIRQQIRTIDRTLPLLQSPLPQRYFLPDARHKPMPLSFFAANRFTAEIRTPKICQTANFFSLKAKNKVIEVPPADVRIDGSAHRFS